METGDMVCKVRGLWEMAQKKEIFTSSCFKSHVIWGILMLRWVFFKQGRLLAGT